MEIELTDGVNVTLVDDDMHTWLSQYNWWLRGTAGRPEYAAAYIDGVRTYMHRLITGLGKDARGTNGQRLIVHHLNGDPLDNRSANLVVLTQGDHQRAEAAIRQGVAA